MITSEVRGLLLVDDAGSGSVRHTTRSGFRAKRLPEDVLSCPALRFARANGQAGCPSHAFRRRPGWREPRRGIAPASRVAWSVGLEQPAKGRFGLA